MRANKRAVTAYSYTYLPNTQTATISTTTNGTTTTQWKTTTFDGFGRSIRVQTGDNSTAVTNVDTQYGACGCSPLGKMTATSMPYPAGGTPYWITYTYDGSGRTLTQAKPDGSATTTSYAGNSVLVTDPAGKFKSYVYDAAGGLETVSEPDPNTGAWGPVTYYWHNAAGQIVQVSVQRGGVAQNRNYGWSGTDLISSTDPETGTTTYQYDGNHHVTQRVDAKNQQTKYTYDAYERLTEVQHYAPPTCQYCQPAEQVNQRVLYTYDVNPLDPGNYTNSWGRLTGVSFQQQTGEGPVFDDLFAYYYSYNQAGRVTTNTFQATSPDGSTMLANLAANYAWDNQGRMTNMTYPSGPQLAYQYDAMGRLSGITSPNVASLYQSVSATYTGAGQLSTLSYGTSYYGPVNVETRSYNSLMQLTRMTTAGTQTVMDMQYNYTAGHNNGRVASTTDNVLGETINYTYDYWNRLTSAAATNGSWGDSYTYDGFGNLTGKTPTAGTAPALSVPSNLATNQAAGTAYDSNGNPSPINPVTGIPGYTWDVENRLVNVGGNVVGTINYSYDPWGRRIWMEIPGYQGAASTGEIYFYGVTGQKLETYSFSYGTSFIASLEGINVYFGGKLLQSKGNWVATDKLGSVRWNASLGAINYWPYGEERTSTSNGVEKFGTYTRDAVGQDYAAQRYYGASTGAFWTPDPGGITTASPRNPSSWNRYAYVEGDPVNFVDPGGRMLCNPDVCSEAPVKTCSDGDPICSDPSGSGSGEPTTPTQQGGGGGSGGRAEAQWSSMGPQCQHALQTAMPNTSIAGMVAAVNRAQAALGTLVTAAAPTSISWDLLAAIGIRESGFKNLSEADGAGVGVGVFQVTVSATSGVTAAQAGNLAWSANYAAQLLNSDMQILAAKFPGLTSAQLWQATADAYNFGTGNISGNPSTMDIGSAHNNYGSNVMQLMTCFPAGGGQ